MSTEWTDAEVTVQATGETLDGRVRISENGEVEFWRQQRGEGQERPTRRFGFFLGWAEMMAKIEQPYWYRIWWRIVARMDRDKGTLRYNLGDLAGDEDVLARRQAWRAIAELADKGMIVKIGRASLMVNPDLVWAGDQGTQAAARVEFQRRRKEVA